MTTYVEALTSAVLEEIKNGDPEQFETDFRTAYLKAAAKESLSQGQRNSFWSTVRTRVKKRLVSSRRHAPPIRTVSQVEMAFAVRSPDSPGQPQPSAGMPEATRRWFERWNAGRATK